MDGAVARAVVPHRVLLRSEKTDGVVDEEIALNLRLPVLRSSLPIYGGPPIIDRSALLAKLQPDAMRDVRRKEYASALHCDHRRNRIPRPSRQDAL